MTPALDAERFLLVGFGQTGQAVARSLVSRGLAVVAADDAPGDAALAVANELGVTLDAAPDPDRLAALVSDVDALLPTPGLPESHPAFAAAAASGVEVLSEFDLAAAWDDRPWVAVTGTDGKTTVTTLVAEMLERSGRRSALAGNNDVPLVTAIDDPDAEVFVVEASSFRLNHSRWFAPDVATWLNFAVDHLDVHRDLATYERAKARIWRDQASGQVAIGNLDDPVVARHLGSVVARAQTFGAGPDADYRPAGDQLVGPNGPIVAIDAMPRRLPHDVANALAASATALAAGATTDGVRATLESFAGLPHRLMLVAERDGVCWYDDSKSTVPHATVAAVRAFPSVVLIAGGRNKGLDLSELGSLAPSLRAVIALGESRDDIAAVFADVVPVEAVATMADAVAAAARTSREGDTVLLSPACASYDQYRNYAERGDDFIARVRALTEERS